MPRIQIPNNWAPRPYQSEPWIYFDQGGLRAVVVGHRRYGKDDIALHLAAAKAIDEPATYWHMLPKATQARRAIWLAVNPHTGIRRIDEAFPPEIRRRTNDNEMFIEFKNGSFWHVVGSDSYNNLVGAPPKGIIFSEWSLCDPAAWAYLEPILLENGGWALFIYTSRGKNHGYTLLKHAEARDNWFSTVMPNDKTHVFTDEQLDEARAGLVMLHGEAAGQVIFDQEYNCAFEGGLPGAYFAVDLSKAEKDGRIASVPYESGVPVRCYFDLGNAPNLRIWFRQDVGVEPRVIDHKVPAGTGVDAVAKCLRDTGYNISELILPHDGGSKSMGDSAGRKYKDILGTATGIPTRVLNRDAVMPGLEACYTLIRKMRMDKDKCETGLNALYSYRREWDEKNKKYKDNPLHDWASHDADGFRYMAIDPEAKIDSGDWNEPETKWMAA